MSKYNVGDKFEIEISEVFSGEYELHGDSKLYRIKGFNSLVFDEYGLNKFKKINEESKTVKASTLAVDTKVICCYLSGEEKFNRFFAKFENGKLYAYIGGGTSWCTEQTSVWPYMTLEDGTVVLPE